MSGFRSTMEKDSTECTGIAIDHSTPSPTSLRAELNLSSTAALAFVLITSAVLMMIFHNRFWAPADEGKYAHVAERILLGQVLHRDVQDLHAGYVNFVNAAAFSLFGVRMVSMRYPLALLT